MKVAVAVIFETEAPHRFLIHDQKFVALSGNGKATIQVEENEFDLLLFGIQGAPGTTAKITLTPEAPAKLEISSHPITGKIAQGKTRWGGSRFFRIRT